eukprot:5720215-Pyramimonas_sp.AAC.1
MRRPPPRPKKLKLNDAGLQNVKYNRKRKKRTTSLKSSSIQRSGETCLPSVLVVVSMCQFLL